MSNDFLRVQWSYPIKQFVIIAPQDVTDCVNALVVDINTNLANLGATAVPTVTQKQMRSWLATNGSPKYIYQVDDACPSDLASAINIQWNHGNTLVQGDGLYAFIQATLGFTPSQMLAAILAMGALTP